MTDNSTSREASLNADACTDRRNFLRVAGGTAAATALFLAGCSDDDGPGNGRPDAAADAGRDVQDARDAEDAPDAEDAEDAPDAGDEVVLDFSADTGVLNYAYALEQLESAFYAMVLAESFGSAINDSAEQDVFNDISAHEDIHSQFYAAALGDNAIGSLQVDFSGVDFGDRDAVIATAQTFEDLGVAAYNGAGILLSNPDFLNAAGKIVSVEARHAAAIRDLTMPSQDFFGGIVDGSPVVDQQGLDRAFGPSQVLEAAAAFITTPIRAINLPSGM